MRDRGRERDRKLDGKRKRERATEMMGECVKEIDFATCDKYRCQTHD